MKLKTRQCKETIVCSLEPKVHYCNNDMHWWWTHRFMKNILLLQRVVLSGNVWYQLVPKSCLSGQSECHLFSQHNSSPLCVCGDEKKEQEKSYCCSSEDWHDGDTPYCFESCQTAVTGFLPGTVEGGWKAWERMMDGPVKHQQLRRTWWLILTREDKKTPTKNLQALHKGWTSAN